MITAPGTAMTGQLGQAGDMHLDPMFVARVDCKQGYVDIEAELDVLRQHGAWADHRNARSWLPSVAGAVKGAFWRWFSVR